MEAAPQVMVEVDSLSVANMRRDLRMFAPLLLGTVDTLLREQGQPIVDEAAARLRALAQTHGVDRFGDPDDAADQYKVRITSKGLVQLVNKSRGASILEFAGKTNQYTHTDRGRTLVNTLNERYGQPGRLLWQAWDEHSEAVQAKVVAIVHDAEAALQRLLDAAV